MSPEQICGLPEASESCGKSSRDIGTCSTHSTISALVPVLNHMVDWRLNEATIPFSRSSTVEPSTGCPGRDRAVAAEPGYA